MHDAGNRKREREEEGERCLLVERAKYRVFQYRERLAGDNMALEQAKSQYLELSLKLPTAYSKFLNELRTLVIGYAQCQGVYDQGYLAYRNYGQVVWRFMQGYVEANTQLRRPQPPHTDLEDQVHITAHFRYMTAQLAAQLEIIHEYLKYKQTNGYYAGHCLEAEFMCYAINAFLAEDVNRLKVEVSRHTGWGRFPNATSHPDSQ